MRNLACSLACAAAAFSSPAHAVVITSAEITNALGEWVQVSELQLFAGAVNVAAAANGGTAAGTGNWPGTVPGNAIDGNTGTAFPNMWHSDGTGPGEKLTVTLSGAFDVTTISIFGRSDCCSNRDLFNYALFNGTTLVASGQLDARNARNFATASLSTAVPEPATWAMMVLGVGAIGFAMRRSRHACPHVRFAF